MGGTVFVRVADRLQDAIYRPGDSASPIGSAFDFDAVLFLSDRGLAHEELCLPWRHGCRL